MNAPRSSFYSIDLSCRLKLRRWALVMAIALLFTNANLVIGEQDVVEYTIVGTGYSQGLVDDQGTYAIPPIYSIEQQAGIYIVRERVSSDQELFGFFNPYSGIFLPPTYDFIWLSDESSALILALQGNKSGYLDKYTGNISIPFVFALPLVPADFHEGFAIVTVTDDCNNESGTKLTLIDEFGKEILLPTGVEIYASSRHGIAEGRLSVVDVETQLIGFIDLSGRMVCHPQFDAVSKYSEGYASVCVNNLWGHIDHYGNWVVPPRFELYQDEGPLYGYEFKHSMAHFESDAGSFVIDTDGTILHYSLFD